MVDDESKPERRPTKHCPIPAEWNSKHNCAYSYYAYYIVSQEWGATGGGCMRKAA